MERGINTFAMHSGLSEDDFGWGSPTFHKMVRKPQTSIYCIQHHRARPLML